MKCKKCGSESVTTQIVTTTKEKKHGFFWKVCVGWWWVPVKWIFLTLPALIFKLFGRKKTVTKHKTVAVCQSCGYSWTP